VLAAIFVDAAVGGAGLAEGRSIADQLAIQITGLVAVLLWSVGLSIAIAKAVQTFAGLRVGNDVEEQGIFAFTANAATTCNQEDFKTSMVN
jgi:ammonium transporter, Amt family